MDFEVLSPYLTSDRIARIDEVLAERTARLVLVAENLYDPHNLAALLRTAEALGLQRVMLAGTSPEEPNPLVALGAEKWLTVTRHPEIRPCLSALKSEGFTIAASALAPSAVDPAGWEPPGPVALLVGNEHDGLSRDALEGSDAVLRIPLRGFSRSLNLSVAAGILMWEILRKNALGERGLPARECSTLRDLWARQSLERSEAILAHLRRENDPEDSPRRRGGAEGTGSGSSQKKD